MWWLLVVIVGGFTASSRSDSNSNSESDCFADSDSAWASTVTESYPDTWRDRRLLCLAERQRFQQRIQFFAMVNN